MTWFAFGMGIIFGMFISAVITGAAVLNRAKYLGIEMMPDVDEVEL